jgi:hypothetical protein
MEIGVDQSVGLWFSDTWLTETSDVVRLQLLQATVPGLAGNR